MKKIMSVFTAALLAASAFAGCVGASASGFDASRNISVISREDGSGTRGAFIELFGVQEKTQDGKTVDHTTKEANIADKTDIMLSGVSGDPHSIGYVSLGSLNNTVKAVDIDGVKATAENVKNGSYKIARPFNIVTKGDATGVAKDFIDFILSKEGQTVVSKSYIAISDSAPAYAGSKPQGKIVVAGSSSVTPVMEKLKEAYTEINPNAAIEIQQSDSTTGMKAAIDGICDIGMASRDLKDSELETLKPIEIALDGIAVIVNTANTTTNMTKEQVKAIFTGEATKWNEAV